MVIVLAYDLGASNGRLTAQQFDGHRLSIEEIHRFTNEVLPVGDHFYWDYAQMVNELEAGLSKISSKEAASLGVDTWGVDFGCLNASGQLIQNPYSYRDMHSAPYVEQVKHHYSHYTLYRRTGNEISIINTLFQLMAMAEHDEDVLRQCTDILMMPNLFMHALSGEKINEFTIASTSQLVNLQTKQWDTELITDLIRVPISLAPIGQTHQIVGQLLQYPSIKMALVPGHDTACALSALPIEQSGSIFISLGTWGLIGTELDQPVVSKEAFEQGFTNEGTSEKTIRFQKNATGFWILQKIRKEWQQAHNKMTFEQEAQAFEQAQPFRSIIHPEDKCFFNPSSMMQAIAQFCIETNQPVPTSIGAYIRCFTESLAIYYAKIISTIETVTNNLSDTVYIGGGGTQNELLCQLIANASGKRVVAGPVEASSIGNGLSQLRALGEIHTIQDGREIVKASFLLKEYVPQQTKLWDEMKKEFSHII